jgi:hypothetical protein
MFIVLICLINMRLSYKFGSNINLEGEDEAQPITKWDDKRGRPLTFLAAFGYNRYTYREEFANLKKDKTYNLYIKELKKLEVLEIKQKLQELKSLEMSSAEVDEKRLDKLRKLQKIGKLKLPKISSIPENSDNSEKTENSDSQNPASIEDLKNLIKGRDDPELEDDKKTYPLEIKNLILYKAIMNEGGWTYQVTRKIPLYEDRHQNLNMNTNNVGELYTRTNIAYSILTHRKKKKILITISGTVGEIQLKQELESMKAYKLENNMFGIDMNKHFQVYRYFGDVFEQIKDQLDQDLRVLQPLLQNSEYQTIVTGHSLGAAVAALIAYYLEIVKSNEYSNEKQLFLFSLGSPRVVNFDFANEFFKQSDKLYGERIVNQKDFIVTFPSCSSKDNIHCINQRNMHEVTGKDLDQNLEFVEDRFEPWHFKGYRLVKDLKSIETIPVDKSEGSTSGIDDDDNGLLSDRRDIQNSIIGPKGIKIPNWERHRYYFQLCVPELNRLQGEIIPREFDLQYWDRKEKNPHLSYGDKILNFILTWYLKFVFIG